MRQQRVSMDQFDRNLALQHVPVAHGFSGQKQSPVQTVFPDNTMSVGTVALPRAMFPVDSEAPETEQDRERRLMQDEPIVVYTSLSDGRILMPEIVWKWFGMMLLLFSQAVCIICVLAGQADTLLSEADGQSSPSACQAGLYVALLALHVWFFFSMYHWSADMLTVYYVLATLMLVLIAAFAVRGLLDVLVAVLMLPVLFLTRSLRDLMMPHCFVMK